MALTKVWMPKAVSTFDTIITYLESEWTENEVRSFIRQVGAVIAQIALELVKHRYSK